MWVLIFWMNLTAVGRYSTRAQCMETGYRVQQALNIPLATFYRIEEAE